MNIEISQALRRDFSYLIAEQGWTLGLAVRVTLNFGHS